MTIDEIRELIQLIVETGVAEIELQRGENRVRIRRTFGTTTEVVVPQLNGPHSVPSEVAPPTTPHPSVTPQMSGHHSSAGAAVAAAPDTILVKSPIVGTYYDAPSPGTPPFVKVGDPWSPARFFASSSP